MQIKQIARLINVYLAIYMLLVGMLLGAWLMNTTNSSRAAVFDALVGQTVRAEQEASYYRWLLPSCQEDQAILGSGDFQDGRWTAYQCGPAVDDYRGE